MNLEDRERHTAGAGIALREASAYITAAVQLLAAMGVHSTVLPDLAVWLADLAHEFDPSHTRAPQEYRHAPQPPTE